MDLVSKPLVERRRFGRRTCCKTAVAVGNPGSKVRCTIIDISEGGARVRTSLVNELPGEFMLLVPNDDLVHYCRVVHRHIDSVGVTFTRLPRKLSHLIKGGL